MTVDEAFRLHQAEGARERRRTLAAAAKCINGAHHGPPKGVRCDWCAAVHRRGVAVVERDANAPARPVTPSRSR